MTEIERIRSERGMSRSALARATGLDVATIYRYERWDRQPDLAVAARIADALECSLDELAGRRPRR